MKSAVVRSGHLAARSLRTRLLALTVGGLAVSAFVTVSGAATVTTEPSTATTPASDFLSFGHDVFAITPRAQKTINGVTLRLTDDADFQVVDDRGAILWHTATTGPCHEDCRVVLQSDGNLVLYADNGSLWSSDTSGFPGSTLIFQPRNSYLTIRDAGYDVVWTSNGDKAAGAAGMLTGALDGTRAVPVRDFLDSLAVNTHMDQYERDATEVLRKLDYLGVRTIRDHYAVDGSLHDEYTFLARSGIRFDMAPSSSDIDELVRDAGTMAAMPNSPLIAVEGPNEINNFPFTCGGSVWTGGWHNDNGPAAACFMQDYYRRVKQDPRLANVAVYHLTGGTSVTDPDRYGLLALTDQADLGNIHPYPAATDHPRDVLLTSLGSQYLSVPPNRAVITETGYETSTVSRRAQALYSMNLYLDAFQSGFRTTYLYELTDNDHETFGLFDRNNTPKLSAKALHNMTSVLADTGRSVDGVLNYWVDGLPQEARSLALQRSSGAFDLVLWDERPIWNGGDVVAPAVPVTVSLGRTFSTVSVYYPLRAATAADQQSNTSTLRVALSGEPVILELTP